MNVTTAARHHWLEQPLLIGAMVLPFSYLVQADPAVVFIASLASEVLGHFIHLNAKLSLGRWNWLFANPHTHRVHHSYAPEHIDKNFAAYFPILDVIFGTYYAPRPGEFPSTGVKSGYVPTFAEAVTVAR